MSDNVTRVIKIIEYLATSQDWVSLRTMARDLDINTAAVYRVLNSLKESGYVQKHPVDSRYQLTLKIAWVSAQVLEKLQLRQVAHPFMERLTSLTNETTHLAILDGNEFVYIDKVDNKQAMRMRSRVGQRGQLHSTAVGKSLLAFLPEDELPKFLAHLTFQPVTNNTITDKNTLLAQLEQIRRLGYATDDEENEIGIRCIGSPIFDHTGRLVGALSISGWTITMTPERIPQLALELIETSQEISRELGYNNEKSNGFSKTPL
jgi:IclR family acetate operon transcriptional repressor